MSSGLVGVGLAASLLPHPVPGMSVAAAAPPASAAIVQPAAPREILLHGRLIVRRSCGAAGPAQPWSLPAPVAAAGSPPPG